MRARPLRRSGLILGLIIVGVVGRVAPSYYTGLMTEAMILGIFSVSLNLLLGQTGLPSLGHAAYFGVAGYTTAILAVRLGQNPWVSAGAGVVASLIVAGLFGLLVLRTSGVYFMMITLALAQVLWGIAFGWRSMTGGDDGLPGVARPNLGPLVPWSVQSPANFFTAVLIVFVVVAGARVLFLRSPVRLPPSGIC